MKLIKLTEADLEEAMTLYIDIFTQPPWNDEYPSPAPVRELFLNHFHNNYFLGYGLKDKGKLVAFSLGFQKLWIKGKEYYIEQFGVLPRRQRQGIGSFFLRLIQEQIKKEGLNAMILNTENGSPSEDFYRKNGFNAIEGLLTLAKEI